MIKAEKHLYKHIRGWLGRHGYVVDEEWENTGPGKLRVDVIGVRNSGTQFCDDIEIVAVEAKMWGGYQALGQAENYRDFAHKVYFATASKEKAESLTEGCIDKNLGLLYLNSSGGVTESLSAPVIKPKSDAKMIEFLANLYIGRCSICRCYFDIWEEWDDAKFLTRTTQFKKNGSRVHVYICKACKEMLDKDYGYDFWENCIKPDRKRHGKRIRSLDSKYRGWFKSNENYYDNQIKMLKEKSRDIDWYYYGEIKKLRKKLARIT